MNAEKTTDLPQDTITVWHVTEPVDVIVVVMSCTSILEPLGVIVFAAIP